MSTILIRSSSFAVEVEFATETGPHVVLMSTQEAYALANFLEWLLDPRPDLEEPSSVSNLPDNLALNVGYEPCEGCGGDHPVVFVATSLEDSGAFKAVHVVELRLIQDFQDFYHFLVASAVELSTNGGAPECVSN